jgi:hypothetical protein
MKHWCQVVLCIDAKNKTITILRFLKEVKKGLYAVLGVI